MVAIISTILVNAVSITVGSYLLEGVKVKNFVHALIAAVVLGVLNWLVKPILAFLAFPITFLTLGLFTLVINAVILMFVDMLLPGLKIKNFWWALVFGLIIAIINTLLFMFLPGRG